MSGTINIKQVARAAEVSVATVSRALQAPEVVAPDTLERVLAVIKQLGYTPNAQARNLRKARTNVVVALAPDIASPFYAEVIQGIEDVAQRNGYSVMVGDTRFDPRREQDYARVLASRQADGMISLLPHAAGRAQEPAGPVVQACERPADDRISCVHADNASGAEAATRHLLELGHRTVAFIGGPGASPRCADRRRGYRAALEAHGLEPAGMLEMEGDLTAYGGVAAIETLLDGGAGFTAVLCANDETALGAMSALRARGLRVPQDVSVVGFEDIRLARYFHPPLTTVTLPMADIGRQAMRLLLEKLDNPEAPAQRHVLPAQLVVRGSTAPPA